MREVYDKEKLPERMEQAELWGIDVDSLLTRRITFIKEGLVSLKAGLGECGITEMTSQEKLKTTLSHVVESMANGGGLESKDISTIAKMVGSLQAVRILKSELEGRIQRDERDEILAEAALSNHLAGQINEKQDFLKQKYDAFRNGQADRPISGATGPCHENIRCESCLRLIGIVDGATFGYPLSPAMFLELGGALRYIFANNQYQCPACRGRAIFDENYVLTEKFEFLQVSSNRGGNSDTDGERIPK